MFTAIGIYSARVFRWKNSSEISVGRHQLVPLMN